VSVAFSLAVEKYAKESRFAYVFRVLLLDMPPSRTDITRPTRKTGAEGKRMNENPQNTIPTDDRFAVKVSDSMEVRNMLRTGLVEAQGRDSDKIPLFVSWPDWLDDGIVCLYARDLRQLLRETVRDTAGTLGKFIEEPE
jgi:hypothetical protein